MNSRTATLIVCLGLAVLNTVDNSAWSATYTWDSDGVAGNGAQDGNGVWSSANLNWFLNTGTADIGWPNNTTDVAAFGISGGAGASIAIGQSLSVGGLQFNGADSGNFSFSGSQTLTIGSSGIAVQSGAGAESFAAAVSFALAGSQTWTNNGANSLSIGGSITGSAAANTTLTLSGSGPISLGTLADGAGKQLSLSASGTGTVTLASASSFTGGTTLTSGTLVAGNSQAFGPASSPLVLNGGSLDLGIDSSIATYNTTVGGDTTVVVDRASSGTGSFHTLGTLGIGANKLTVKAGANVNSGTAALTFGNVTLSGSPTFDVQNNVSGASTQLTLGAVNFGSGVRTLVKNGGGTLIVGGPASGLSASTGLNQTINAGTLQFSASNGWNGSASRDGILTLSPTAGNTASYQTPNFAQQVTSVTIAGDANTTSAIGLGTSGTLTIRSATNSVVYDATNNPGTATVSGDISSKFQLPTTSTANLVINDSTNTTTEVVIAAPVYGGSFTKSGGGTLVLQGANANSGNMTVSGGILRFDSANSFASTVRLTLSGAIAELGAGQTTFTHATGTTTSQINITGATAGFGNSAATAANINLDTATTTAPLWDDPVNAGFSPTTFQLGTSASLAPLNLVGGINFSATSAHAIQVDRGNFTLSGVNYYDAQIQQSTSTMLGNSGDSLAKQGSGVLSITGSSSLAGTLNVNAGTVLLANTSGNAWGTGTINVASLATLGGAGTTGGPLTLTSGAHLAPGNGVNGAGLLTIGANVAVNNSAILDFDLNSPNAAIGTGGNDGLKITSGQLTLGTGLTLNITPGASFGNGTYQLMQFNGAGPAAGTLTNFATVNGPTKTYTFASTAQLNGFITMTVSGSSSQYWDLNGPTAGAGGFGSPSGTWDSSTANWSTNSAGTAATGNWGSGNDAIFSAGSDATGVYAITVSGAQNANSITFKDGTPTITGGSLNISGPGGSVTVATASASIGSLLNGTAGLTKSGNGILNLTNAANTYTGVTTISGGILNVATLAVEGAGGGTASSLGSAGNAAANLVINGGTLQYTNNTGGTTDHSFMIGTSGATLDASGPGGGLAFNSSTPAIAFSSSASPASLTLTGTNAGSIAAVIGNSGTATNITSVTKMGIGAWTLSGANTYTGITTVSGGTLQFTTAAVEGSGGGVASALGAAGNAAAKLVINGGTLQFSGTSSQTTDRSFTIGTSGATLSTSSSPGTSITFNSTTPAVAFSSPNTAAALTLTGQSGTSGTLGAVLGNNGSGVVSLTKSGLGSWTLSAIDTYSGATTINLGTLSVTGSIATSAVTVNGGAIGGTGTIGSLIVNSGGAVSPGSSPGTLTAGNTTWNGGGSYTWEINSVAGGGTTATPTGNLSASQGHDPGWDALAVSGTLTIGSTTGSPFAVNVTGLNTSNAPGAVSLFNQNAPYAWNIATATTAISGFTAANQFSVSATSFTNSNSIGTGTFSVSTTGVGANSAVYLAYTPNTLGVMAADNAANYSSFGGSTTLNKGAGFGNWQFSPNPNTGTGGYFLGDAGINSGGSNNAAPSGNWINARTTTTGNGSSWGLYANSGNVTSAIRSITGGLPIGQTFAVDFDNGFLNNGSSQGFSLLNSSNDTANGKLFEFFFKNGGANAYSVTTSGTSTAETITGTTSGFTGNGLHVEFTQTSATAFTMTVSGPNITTQTITGSLLTPSTGNSTIAGFRPFAFNANAGDTSSDFNAFFNNAMVLLPTWNGQSAGILGGNFSAAKWAGHAPVNGGSIAFDGTGGTVTNDSANSGITSLYNIQFNSSTAGIAGASGPNVNVTTNAGPYTLQSTGLGAGGLTLAGGLTNNSTNLQTINFAGSGAVGITLAAAQTFNGGTGGLWFGPSTGINLNGNALTVIGTGTGSNAITFGGVLSGTAAGSSLLKQQSGTLIINAAGTYAGSTTIGTSPNTSGGTIQLGIVNGLPTTTSLIFYDNNSTRSTLDLHGFGQTVASLNDGGNNSGLITNAGGGTPTFALSNTDSNFYYGLLTGSLAFAKSGTGSEEIGGANTFSGGAAVKAGELFLTSSNVSTTSGPLGPSTNAITLGGTTGNLNAAISLGRAGGAGPGSAGGVTFANNIVVQDGNTGQMYLIGRNRSGVSTFSGNVTLGSSPAGKLLILSADPGGEVDFTGNVLGGGDATAGVWLSAGSFNGSAGVIKLFGANTYTGATPVDGKVILAATASLATSSINAASDASISALASAGGMAGGKAMVLASGSGANGGALFDMIDNRIGVFNLNGIGSALGIGGSGTSLNAPTLTFEIGNGSTGTDRIALTGGGTASIGASGGKVNVNAVAGITSVTHGTYTLISTGGAFPSGLTFSNGTTSATLSLGANHPTYNLTLAPSGNNEVLNVAVATPPSAYWSGAASSVWNTINSGDTTNWRTDAASNIDTQQIPGATSNVFFGTTTPVASNLTNTLGQDMSIASLTFVAGAGPATIGGSNNLTIAAGITNNSPSAQTINTSTLTLAAAQSFDPGAASGGSLTIGAPGASTLANGGFRLTVSDSNPTTINSAITGAGDLLKQGTGTLTLAGSSTFGPTAAGSTNIFFDQGTVALAGSNAAGSTANTGRIAMGSSVNLNQDTALSISAAGINVANPIDVRHFSAVNGAKTIGATNATGAATYSGDISLHDNVTFSAAGGTLTFTGAISTGTAGSPYANEDVFTGIPTGGFNAGPGIMTAGTGTIELTGANSFNGEIIVNDGITLQAKGGGTFGNGVNNAVRMYGNSTVNIADATTISTRINPHGTPGGDLQTIGATNAAATTATYAGNVFLDDNATLFSANAGATVSFTGATFDIKNHVLTVAGSGNTSIAATISNSATGGSLIKTGLGTLTLSAAAGNSYSGGTAIGGGTLRASNTSGSATGSGAVGINSGGTLGGGGIITGAVNINAGGTLSPGNSPGSITLGATTYNDGGTYRWEISNWTGTQGTDYDFQSTTGVLTIAATPGTFPTNTFKIDITGLSGGSPGHIANFDAAHSRSWTIAEASAGISGFAANKFTIDTSHVVDNLSGGGFSLSTVNGAGSIQDLVLSFTPGVSGTTYNLAAIAGAANIHVSTAPANTSSAITATIANAGGPSADSLDFTGLTVSPSGGAVGSPATLPKDGGPLANSGGSDSGTVTFRSATAGSFTLTPTVATATNHGLGGSATLGTTTTASVTVWRLAAANSIASPGNLGAFHVGSTIQSPLSVTNTAAADGFSEKLDATLGGATGDAVASGSVSLLAPQASDPSSLVLSIDGSTAASKSGTATVSLTSNGSGTSNLGTTALASQMVSISAQVFSGKMAWNPTAGSGNWAADSNWTDTISTATAGAPGLSGPLSAGDTATFDSAAAPTTVSLLNSSPHVATVTLAGPNPYTLAQGAGSGVLHLDNGGGIAAIMATSGGHAISAPIRLDSNLALNITHAGDSLAASGGISDGGAGYSLTKLGPGTFVLSGANTYGGSTLISNGTLRAAAAGALSPNSAVNVSGGTLDISNFANSAAAITVGASGTLRVGLGGAPTSDTLSTTGAASFAGTLAIAGSPTLGSYTLATYGSRGGTFSSATSFPGYTLTYNPMSLLLQHVGTIGQITAIPSSGSIVTGGSLPFSITVQNTGPAGGADLNFSASAGANVSGSIAGPVNVPAGSTSAPQPGLAFNGASVGPSQTGLFTVSDPTASNSPQGGSVSVNVFDHASTGGFNGGTISLPSVIVGYSGPVAGGSSFTVANGSAADYRVNLKAAGGTAGSVSVSGFSGVAPGASGTISASLAAGRAAGPVNEVIAVTLADDSPLAGANANLLTKNITVTGNIFAHATPSDDSGLPGTFSGGTLDLGNIHQGYSSPVSSLGSISVFNGTVGDNRVPISGGGMQTGGSTAGLSLNSIGGGGALAPGGSAQISATLAPGLAAGTISQNFIYTSADDSTLNGASANVGTATITVTGNVYSGQSIWRGRQAFPGAQPLASTSGNWGTFTNWSGGAPGLDPNFAASDSATFGAQSGSVTVDLAGVSPHVVALTFNHTGSYTITDSSGTGSIAMSGPAPTITAGGTHTVAAPLTLSATTSVTVTEAADSLTISGLIGGASAGLAKLGAGTLTLAHANSFGGGLTISAGTLRTTANGGLSNGPLAVNATAGATATANIASNESVSRLTATQTGNGVASVVVATGKSLTVNQSSTSSFTGTVNLAGPAATLAKWGGGILEIDRGPNLSDGAIVNIGAGTLRFDVSSGIATVGSGVMASVAPGASLELAGSVSALSGDSAATHRVDVSNSGTLSVGNISLTATTLQQVGAVDGTGIVQVNVGATLAANHIIQSSLIIGGGATAVISASDPNGLPLGETQSQPQTAVGYSAALAALTTLENNGPSPIESPPSSPVWLQFTPSPPSPPPPLSFVAVPICVVGEMCPVAPVPEPSAWLLAACAAALLVAAGRRRSQRRISSSRT